jgi:hypothetical protein
MTDGSLVVIASLNPLKTLRNLSIPSLNYSGFLSLERLRYEFALIIRSLRLEFTRTNDRGDQDLLLSRKYTKRQ